MKIHLIAMGNRMSDWVMQGYHNYAKRLPHHCQLNLIQIPLYKRTKHQDQQRLLQREGEKMVATIPKNCLTIALDVKGERWTSVTLAHQMIDWLASGQDIALLIGGPEGMAPLCLERAKLRWSLSPMTLPHPLARIMVAEQLYRGWTIISHHPYHL